MPATKIDYHAEDTLEEYIDLGQHDAMPLRRLSPQDKVVVLLQHRRDHSVSVGYSWNGEHVTQTGARAVTLTVPVADLPQGGRWAVWAEATIPGDGFKHPERGRNIRVEK